jgi:DNA polymerase beta
MTDTTTTPKITNEQIIQSLYELASMNSIIGLDYKEKAYRTAANRIGSYIGSQGAMYQLSVDDLDKIPGIGSGIKKKLIELITTGSIADLIKLRNSREIKAFKEFRGIIGVGPVTIQSWMRSGIFTISDLRKAVGEKRIKLTPAQTYGLMYYVDLNQRIPREEVTEISHIVHSILLELDPDILFVVAGSYRRGLSSSGDIDCLVCSKSHGFTTETFIERIRNSKYGSNFIDTIRCGHEMTSFLYKHNGIVRQIDILNLPIEQYWPGVLYFTGSWDFNEAMRSYAKSRGFLLNQKGLFAKTPKGKKLLVLKSEEDIFDILGLKYIPPAQREQPLLIPK